MQHKIYRFISTAIGPIIDLWLMHRRKIGKEDPKRYSERLGHPGFPRPSGSLVWVHAASVGEIMSVLPLINNISKNHNDINILITTGTVTSAKLVEGRLPERTFHQYIPIDKPIAVKRFLSHWKPDLALWVESELWPNLIIETNKTGCPMIQINARISIASFDKWQRYKGLAKEMLSCFSLSLAQSEEDKERLATLGAKNAKYTGNLKFDAPALPADPAETGKMVNMTGDRPIWIAASTHNGEEEKIAVVHKKLQEKHDSILTIISPRHPERGSEIKKALSNADLSVSLRSDGDEVTDNTDIYIANTIGELGIFYRLAGIVFMGGSLVKHGGQNPLEAARLECALITGPHTGNFSRIYLELEQNNAILRVSDMSDLADKIDELLTNHDKQQELALTILELMKSKEGVINIFLDELAPYIKPLSKSVNQDENA